MIVVIGSPIGRLDDDVLLAGGTAAHIALAAARGGAEVQLVGKMGDDPTADTVILDLARRGVGHVALLRVTGGATPLEPVGLGEMDEPPIDDMDLVESSPASRSRGLALEAADVELGLRYLTDFAVVVLAEPADPETIAVVADAARYAEARLILVIEADTTPPEGLPDDAVVLEVASTDPQDAFTDLVGAFAAALDAETDPGVAFRSSIASDGWTEAGGA